MNVQNMLTVLNERFKADSNLIDIKYDEEDEGILVIVKEEYSEWQEFCDGVEKCAVADDLYVYVLVISGQMYCKRAQSMATQEVERKMR